MHSLSSIWAQFVFHMSKVCVCTVCLRHEQSLQSLRVHSLSSIWAKTFFRMWHYDPLWPILLCYVVEYVYMFYPFLLRHGVRYGIRLHLDWDLICYGIFLFFELLNLSIFLYFFNWVFVNFNINHIKGCIYGFKNWINEKTGKGSDSDITWMLSKFQN